MDISIPTDFAFKQKASAEYFVKYQCKTQVTNMAQFNRNKQ